MTYSRKLCLFALAMPVTMFAASAPSDLTPAQRAIRSAEERISKQPDHATYYNQLAMAYARRARENSDVTFYTKAEEAVAKSLQLLPDNFEALKARAWVLLGQHEFAKALDLAKELNARVPDDTTVYGYLADANVELVRLFKVRHHGFCSAWPPHIQRISSARGQPPGQP